MKFQIYVVVTLTLYVASCQSLYNKRSYVKAPASGAISDEEWVYLYGYTDAEAKKPEGIEHLIVLSAGTPKTACPVETDRPKDTRQVVIGIDGKVGEMIVGGNSGQYETSDDVFTYRRQQRIGSVAFVNPTLPVEKQYQFATSGKIKVTKITNDVIEGLVLAKSSPKHFVNGKFKAKLCKWGQLN